jgi:hypothetical protein
MLASRDQCRNIARSQVIVATALFRGPLMIRPVAVEKVPFPEIRLNWVTRNVYPVGENRL